MIKVEIVETRPVYRLGLVAVLTDAGMKVVSARSSLDARQPWRGDVLVLDSDALADAETSEAVATLTRATQVLLLTSGEDVVDHVAAGVSGTVSRDDGVEVLLSSIHTAVSGGAPAVRPTAPAAVPEADVIPLSPREQQVLRQIARGRTHTQIARALGISHHTVDTYVKRIRSKLDLGNKAELTRAAVLGDY